MCFAMVPTGQTKFLMVISGATGVWFAKQRGSPELVAERL